MAPKIWWIGLALVLGGAACAPTTTAQGDTTITKADAPRGCPLGVPGAIVSVQDTDDGVALAFVSADKPVELRERVHYAAAQHGPAQKLGLGHDGKHGDGGDHGLQAFQMPPMYAGVEDLDKGARLVLTPVDAADRDALRAKARERAEHMMTSACTVKGR